MQIRSYLEDQSRFEPQQVEAPSAALIEACSLLKIADHDKAARETVATRNIDLARTGVFHAKALRDRMVREAKS